MGICQRIVNQAGYGILKWKTKRHANILYINMCILSMLKYSWLMEHFDRVGMGQMLMLFCDCFPR